VADKPKSMEDKSKYTTGTPTTSSTEKMTEEERRRREQALRNAMQDKMNAAGDTAPTTKTTMGQKFAAGGYVRAADGCVRKGHTKGRMI
jgi:hypothetical protein